MDIALWALRILGVYLAIGGLFAMWFVVSGVGRISPSARGTGWGFRVLIAPGSAALWPVLVFELVASRGRGGVVVGRVLSVDDVETAIDDVPTDDGSQVEEMALPPRDPVRYVDPDAETDVDTGADIGSDIGADESGLGHRGSASESGGGR